jgi:hypothetical protein
VLCVWCVWCVRNGCDVSEKACNMWSGHGCFRVPKYPVHVRVMCVSVRMRFRLGAKVTKKDQE